MSDARSSLDDFIAKQTGEPGGSPDGADLFASFGIEGDDASEFMEAFATRFQVDMSDYRWYFHHGEEGHNVGGLLFPPPYRRVDRIPITTDVLLSAIQMKRWPLHYPEHRLPKVRWDAGLNLLFVIGSLALATLWLVGIIVR